MQVVAAIETMMIEIVDIIIMMEKVSMIAVTNSGDYDERGGWW